MIALAGFFVGVGLALLAGALYRLGVVWASRPQPDPKAWADHVADAFASQAPRVIDAWWNQLRYQPPVVSVVATPSSAGEQDAVIAQALEAGVNELRTLYEAKGVMRTPDELQQEAFDLLRPTLDLPDDY